MSSLKELLAEVYGYYDVVSLEDRGTTAGDKIKEYDLWYRKDGVVYFKRLHIYIAKDGSAEWYSENPIPTNVQPVKSFDELVRTKLKNVLRNDKNVKHVQIDNVDSGLGRATVTVFLDDSGVVREKKAVVFLSDDGTLAFEILE